MDMRTQKIKATSQNKIATSDISLRDDPKIVPCNSEACKTRLLTEADWNILELGLPGLLVGIPVQRRAGGAAAIVDRGGRL